MITSARPGRGLFAKAAFVAAGAVLLTLLASFVALGGDAHDALIVVVLAALPVLAYVSLRAPVVFPLGLYVVLVPFDPLLGVSGGAGATLTKFVGIACAAALAFRAIATRTLLVPPRSWLVWGAVVLMMAASAMWSIDADITLSTLAIVLQQYLLFTVLAVYPLSARDFTIVRRTVVLAGALVSTYGFYAYASGQRIAGSRLSLSNGELHFDPNHYAAFFSIPLGFVVTAVLVGRGALRRVAYALLFLALFANILMTESRGGFIAASALVLYLGIRTRKFVMTAAVAFAGLAVSLAIPTVWNRFADPTQGDASGRSDIWNAGLHALRQYWLAGSGFATYPDAYDQNLLGSLQRNFAGWHRPAHNLLVQSSVEFGIFGLALVLYAWWNTYRQNANVSENDPWYASRLATEAIVVGLFVSAMSIDLLWFKYLWLGLSLPVLLANVLRPRELWSPANRRATPGSYARAKLRPPARARVPF